MSSQPAFQSASPYQGDLMALPVTDVDVASDWYRQHFGMTEIQRLDQPVPAVVMERDGVRIGFAINGGDASQTGAAIQVSGIDQIKQEFAANGVNVSEPRVDERDGQSFHVFFVVAPDGLCYYVHEPV